MSAFADLPRRWRLLLEDGDEVLATTLVKEPRRALKVEIPAGGTERHTLADQLIVLERDHVGRPLATLCHAALIVLIRREIVLDAALDRFFALWDHHEALLLASLSFRWLVSAADTLVDHGRSPAERGTAFGVVLFANTLKLYETERVFSQSLDPSEADLERQTPGLFPGRDRAVPGAARRHHRQHGQAQGPADRRSGAGRAVAGSGDAARQCGRHGLCEVPEIAQEQDTRMVGGTRYLIFGKGGQVATELARRLPVGASARFLGRDEADLADPAACAAAIRAALPDVVINAAAWTAVDRAEAEEAAARVINGDAPAAMAVACAVLGIPFLHISTDYVFDGAGTAPFAPGDATGPLGSYGRTKLAGERGVQAAGGRWLILRTSWVVSAHGQNFVKSMLRLGAERASLNVVADQIGGPTPAAALAEALYGCAAALRDGATGGLHHFAGAPDTSWADFARAIMAGAGLGCVVNDIPSSAYPTPALRPLNSRLDCSSLSRLGLVRPDWRVGLADILKELKA